MIIFVLFHSLIYWALPFAGGFWLFGLLRPHAARWDDFAYLVGVALVVGIIKARSLWHKMEGFYADSQKQHDSVA